MGRYWKTLKGYFQYYRRPEDNITEGYAIDETLGFRMECMQTYTITNCTIWNDKEEPTMNNKILKGVGWPKIITLELCD